MRRSANVALDAKGPPRSIRTRPATCRQARAQRKRDQRTMPFTTSLGSAGNGTSPETGWDRLLVMKGSGRGVKGEGKRRALRTSGGPADGRTRAGSVPWRACFVTGDHHRDSTIIGVSRTNFLHSMNTMRLELNKCDVATAPACASAVNKTPSHDRLPRLRLCSSPSILDIPSANASRPREPFSSESTLALVGVYKGQGSAARSLSDKLSTRPGRTRSC